MNNYLVKASLGCIVLAFNLSYGMTGPATPPPSADKPQSFKPLLSLKFKRPNAYNSGAAVKKGGIGITRTEEDEIWSLFASFREVCSVTSTTLSDLKLIMRKYGERYPSKRCHIITCADNIEHEYLVFSDKGVNAALLEEKRVRQQLLEDNTCLTAMLLGYEEKDIKYYYKRCNKNYNDSLDYEGDKAAAQKYIDENIPTIRDWAQDTITISYTWPEH